MTPRRIAYVLKVFPKTSETFISLELAELRRRGIELRILSLQTPSNEPRHEVVANSGLHQITSYNPPDFLNVLRQFRPQLLHAHFATEATEMAIDLATELGVPFTFTTHGYDIHRKAPFDFAARAAAARAVVTVSEANAAYIASTFGVPRAHIHVIPCGIDTDLFRPFTRQDKPTQLEALEIATSPASEPKATKWRDCEHLPIRSAPSISSAWKSGQRSDEPLSEETAGHNNQQAARNPEWQGENKRALPLVLCVARQVPVKNLALLLQTCAKLRERGTSFRCVLVGDGPCRDSLEADRLRLGLEGVVEMIGAADQSAVLNWWQKASIGVLTSNNEGMPVSLMEAAGCGVPVIATAVGGVPELVADGVTGLLVPPANAIALAKALDLLIEDADLRSRFGRAARQRAEERFSVKRQVDQLLALWSDVLASGKVTDVFVVDLFHAADDPLIPTLAQALDPERAKEELKRHLPRLSGENGKLRLKTIRVIRHKPGKRCLVEYEVRVQRPNAPAEKVTIIGKARSKRFGKEGYRLLDQLWKAGFDSASPDGISVPEPVGFIPRFQMWFQRKVPGRTATGLLGGAQGADLARHIAAAIHKVHQANIPAERKHSMADELRILHECLAKVAEIHPDWRQRLGNILNASDQLGASVPEPRPCGIHRDFYPAQVVVESMSQSQSPWEKSTPRIYLVDFDLYCLGDPGLDVGNFLGHMIEQTLREKGSADASAKAEQALEGAFIELAGELCRAAVHAYTTLTLVRHIYLSSQFRQRQPFTPALVALCEQRLGIT